MVISWSKTIAITMINDIVQHSDEIVQNNGDGYVVVAAHHGVAGCGWSIGSQSSETPETIDHEEPSWDMCNRILREASSNNHHRVNIMEWPSLIIRNGNIWTHRPWFTPPSSTISTCCATLISLSNLIVMMPRAQSRYDEVSSAVFTSPLPSQITPDTRFEGQDQGGLPCRWIS